MYRCVASFRREPRSIKVITSNLNVQLDNCSKDNKCQFGFCFWSLLVALLVFGHFFWIFKEEYVSFVLIGRTHEDIDASFGQWCMKLHENDFPLLPHVINKFMELESTHNSTHD